MQTSPPRAPIARAPIAALSAARTAVGLALSSVLFLGCASGPVSGVPQSGSERVVRGAPKGEDYAIGGWHLGLPLHAFAAARPDLWKARRFEAGRDAEAAMTIGSRHAAADDVLGGSHLVFLGVAPKDEAHEDSFVPVVVVALGPSATELLQPALPTLASGAAGGASLGPVDFAFEQSMGDDEEKRLLEDALKDPAIDASQKQRMDAALRSRPPWPKSLRVESHAPHVATLTVDGQLLGYVIGNIPRSGGGRFYEGMRRLILTHLRLR